MTYKLNPIIEKMQSPVRIILPDESVREYESGADAAADTFDNHYNIQSIKSDGNIIEIKAEAVESPDTTFF